MTLINGKIVVNEMTKITSEEIFQMIETLDESEKQKLLHKLNPGVTIIFGGSSFISYGTTLQINTKDDIKQSLEKIPPEALGEFLKALGVYIAKNNF